MLRSRPQFGLKTALAVMAILSIGCALVKYEHDANANFTVAGAAVRGALTKVAPETAETLFRRWQQEVQSNPTYAANHWGSHMVVDNLGGETTIADYFGSSHDWHYVLTIPSGTADFSRLPIRPTENRIDVDVICSRPWSVLSRQTSIQIIEHPAPDNSLFTDPLKAELEQAGMQFEVIKQF